MILRARQLSVALVLGGVWFAAALLIWLTVFSACAKMRVSSCSTRCCRCLRRSRRSRGWSSSISTAIAWRATDPGRGAGWSWPICSKKLRGRSRPRLASTSCCRSRTGCRRRGWRAISASRLIAKTSPILRANCPTETPRSPMRSSRLPRYSASYSVRPRARRRPQFHFLRAGASRHRTSGRPMARSDRCQ